MFPVASERTLPGAVTRKKLLLVLLLLFLGALVPGEPLVLLSILVSNSAAPFVTPRAPRGTHTTAASGSGTRMDVHDTASTGVRSVVVSSSSSIAAFPFGRLHVLREGERETLSLSRDMFKAYHMYLW